MSQPSTTCADCRHFASVVDPHNIGARRGECRLLPHVVAIPNPATRQVVFAPLYVPVGDDFPACSHHAVAAPANPRFLAFVPDADAEGEQD